MRRRILVTRPLPEAERTAARLQAAGVTPVLSPLLHIEPMDWVLPDAVPDAVLISSGRAVRAGDARLAALLALPCYCVGPASARAAEAAGFGDIQTPATEGVAAALALALAAGALPETGRILHLAGHDRTACVPPQGLTIDMVETYRAVLQRLDAAAAAGLAGGRIDATLLYSARTARQFAAEADRLALARGRHAIACLSEAIAAAAGPGWGQVTVTAEATEPALLAAIGLR